MDTTDLVKSSFKYNILIMKIFGIYPYDSFPKIYTIYAYTFYIIFTLPVPVLSVVNLILVREKDISKICDSAFLTSQIGILILKLLPLKNHPENTKRTLDTLHSPIFNTFLPRQKNMVAEGIKECRTMFYIFFTCCMVSLFSWPLKALHSEERMFPIELWLPYEPFENGVVYYSTFLVLFLGVSNAAVDNSSLDTLIAGLIYHAAVQLRIVKDNLQNLAQLVEEDISDGSGSSDSANREILRAKVTYSKICEYIVHYDAIYDFVKDVEDTYNFVLFTQFIASIFVICISCYRLSIITPLTVPFFAMVVYVITMFTEIYLYCYYGAVLYEESNTVVTAIYMSEWYNFDRESKKVLLTLMERAKRPMIVTAGKLLDLSLGTFTMIIRRSYSMLAVLKNY